MNEAAGKEMTVAEYFHLVGGRARGSRRAGLQGGCSARGARGGQGGG